MNVLTVSEFNQVVRELLSMQVVAVEGEVSNFHVTRNQLVFFELKDAESYVTCFLLAHQITEPLLDGMRVQVTGYPSIFKKNSTFHLHAQKIEVLGDGNLQKQFQELKKKLEAEGLFAEARKRLIPAFPERIAVVTSEDGAAFTDVKRVLANRWPLAEVTLLSVGVQGVQAISGIVRAITWVSEHAGELDTMILTRGGGSPEDLQAFNSEEVCRAVFSCAVPVIAGVGHERDETLVEYVADRRAATPSNAAELAAPNREDIRYVVETHTERITSLLAARTMSLEHRASELTNRLHHAVRAPLQAVGERTQSFREIAARFEHRVTSASQHVASLAKLLASLSPTNVLHRGYSLTKDSAGRILRDASAVRTGDAVTTVLSSGHFTSIVKQPYGKT